MLRIGIVGSENSHTGAFARILNVTKRLPGAKVVALWGEEEEHTAKVAADCLIPEIVRRPEDLIGKVDAAIVDHRHPKYHVPAATPLVEAGIPVLVDKPFSYTVDEGKELLRLAKKKKVVVTSYSCVRYAPGFRRVHQARKKLAPIIAADFVGPCDIESQYGGVFFYGVHQTEMMVDALGVGAESVTFTRGSGGSHSATVVYGGGGPVVTLHLLTGFHGKFGWGLYGAAGAVHEKLYYQGLYLRGLEAFLRMVATGKNDWSPEQILTSVAVLAAIDRAIKSGRQEAVESVSL
jgi:predicted dehydrogenase